MRKLETKRPDLSVTTTNGTRITFLGTVKRIPLTYSISAKSISVAEQMTSDEAAKTKSEHHGSQHKSTTNTSFRHL